MFEYIPKTVPQKIYVIGVGGTGGRLVPLLAQFLKTVEWVIKPEIVLVDHDIVERKNLKRQNFIEQDVGRPKAVVLAERYSRAFNITITPEVTKITSDKKYFDGWNIPRNIMIIMCVDSAKARREILQSFSHLNYSSPDTLYIDSGNEDSYGQVTFFNPRVLFENNESDVAMKKLPELLPVRGDLPFLPMDWKFFRDMEDLPNTRSCAELDQTLAINAMMATTIMGVVQNYYYNKPFTFNRIYVGLNGGAPARILDYPNIKDTFSPQYSYYSRPDQSKFLRDIGVQGLDSYRVVSSLVSKYNQHMTNKAKAA